MDRLGMALNEARRRLRIDLDEAERDTRVRRAFLVALEEERFDLLPPRAFAQGLLSVYARYLGLDPESLVRQLPPDPRDVFEPWPPTAPSDRPGDSRLWTWTLLVVLAIGGAVLWWMVAQNAGGGPARAP